MKDSKMLFDKLKTSYEMMGEPKSILLGLSGGADSVCLAHLLLRLSCEKKFDLNCVHVNHQLRGNALKDERFVEELCRAWGLKLKIIHVDVSRRGNLEANARTARYAAFEQAMVQNGANTLALGHHMDDQAETVLMRLMRGAGPSGLSSMREYTRQIWRPLLSIRRSETEGYLEREGIVWRDDESNGDIRFTRNAIRSRLIPMMEELSPDCVPNIAATGRLLGVEEDYWNQFSTTWLEENASLHPSCLFLNTQNFDTLHLAARRRVLRAFCIRAEITPDREQLEGMPMLLPRESLNLSGGAKAFRTGGRLHVVKPHSPPLALGTLREIDAPKGNRRRVEVFDADLLEGAQLRYRRPADRIMPLGMQGTQSLSDYLINRHMDRPFRNQWPVLAKGQDVLWVAGFGMAQTAALRRDTRRSKTLAYCGRLPDEGEKDVREHSEHEL